MNLKRYLPHISKFEGRIVAAIMVCAAVPVFISLLFIPSIIASKLAMSMHAAVEQQLEDSALFYGEFFSVKKAEFEAITEKLAQDPRLHTALQKMSIESVLRDHLVAHPQLVRLTVQTGTQTWQAHAPEGTYPSEVTERKVSVPMSKGNLSATFFLENHYVQDRDRAAEIALNYQTARKFETDRARAFYKAYFGILVISVSVAMLVGLILSRSVTRRVMRVANATTEVAQGNMNVRVPVTGDDEIARLSSGFNRMVSEVEEARDRIVYLEKVSGWQDFARHLAHEIKNPLTPIRLAVQELRRRASGQSEEELQKLVKAVSEVVDDEVESLTRLVDEFSQFAKLPSVHPARVHVPRFLDSFYRSYGQYRENIELTMSVPCFDFEAPIDKVLMRRVLVNLVDNAAESGSPSATMLAEFDHGSGITTIRIDDSGSGVSEEHRKQIFEPYFTTKATGTGLGLAIVKKIVLQHRGNIYLESSPQGGASFVIRLPRVPDGLVAETVDPEDEVLQEG